MTNTRSLFHTREEAGEALAQKWRSLHIEHPLILTIPPDGVPVAAGAIRKTPAAVDTTVVRYLPVPDHPYMIFGAIAPGEVIILDNDVVDQTQLSDRDIDAVLRFERQEMERDLVQYHSGQYRGHKKYETVILVDDGLSMDIGARAGIESIHFLYRPKRLIYATPICYPTLLTPIRRTTDDVICLKTPREPIPRERWYEYREHILRSEAIRYLREINTPR